MFLFLSLYFIGRTLFRAHQSLALMALFGIFILILSFAFEDLILAIVNTYRWGFAAEDFSVGNGYSSYAAWNLYGQEVKASLEIFSIEEAILKAFIKLPIFLSLPMPWNWSNPFHVIQTTESIFLICLFAYMTIKDQAYRNKELILLLFILLLSSMLYSLIMANEGTFVRYRFTLFYPFLLAAFFITKNKNEHFKKN